MRLEKGEKSYIRAAATPWPQQVSSRLWEMNLRKSKPELKPEKMKAGILRKSFPTWEPPPSDWRRSFFEAFLLPIKILVLNQDFDFLKPILSLNLFTDWSFVLWMSWLCLDISSTLDVLVELCNLVLTRSERKSKCGALCSSRQHSGEEVASA